MRERAESTKISRWWALLLILLGSVLGAFVGGEIGNFLYTPNGDEFLDFGALAYIFWGGVIGILVGALGGWTAWASASGLFRRAGTNR